MTTATVSNLDFVVVVTMIATYLLGPSAASVVGPYPTIILAALIGSGMALSRRDPTNDDGHPGPRWHGAAYLLLVLSFAVLTTIAICTVLEEFVFHRDVKQLIIPVALAIGWIGKDWPAVFGWVGGVVRRQIVDRIRNGKGNSK